MTKSQTSTEKSREVSTRPKGAGLHGKAPSSPAPEGKPPQEGRAGVGVKNNLKEVAKRDRVCYTVITNSTKGNEMAKKIDCGTCGFREATHYYETDTVHDEGQGEYSCCACDHGSEGCA